MKHRISFVCMVVLGLALLPRPALANFHLMEIEQIIGGVGGDPNAQAVQLKMRFDLQNVLAANSVVLVARDATGNNPVTLFSFTGTTDPLAGPCREILLVSPAMVGKTNPAVTGAYIMTGKIPPTYLPAGTLSFEGLGSVYWRVSWGGAAYTGTLGVLAGINDSDGVTNPPFAGPLPSTSGKALAFVPACATNSTSSAADYAVTASNAVLKNNAAATFTVVPGLPVPGLPGISKLLLPGILGLGVVAFALLRRRRA